MCYYPAIRKDAQLFRRDAERDIRLFENVSCHKPTLCKKWMRNPILLVRSLQVFDLQTKSV